MNIKIACEEKLLAKIPILNTLNVCMFFSASLLKLPRKSFELQAKGAIRNQCSTCLESTVLTKCKLILPSKSTSFHKSFKNNLIFFKSNK